MPFLSHVIQPVVAAPTTGEIGFSDALTSVVDLQAVTSRTPQGIGTYVAAEGYSDIPITRNFTVPAIAKTSDPDVHATLLRPAVGKEWGDHVGIQSNILLTATASKRPQIYITLFTGNVPHIPPRIMFDFEKYGDAAYRITVSAQDPAGSLTQLAQVTGLDRQGGYRFEGKIVNDNEIVVACEYNGATILAPTTYTSFDFSTRGTQVALRLDDPDTSATQIRGNDPGGQLQVDSIPTLIPA